MLAGPTHRKVLLTAVPEQPATYQQLCDGSPPGQLSAGFAGVNTTGAGDQGQVSEDGITVEGRYVHPVTGDVDEWRLQAVRE